MRPTQVYINVDAKNFKGAIEKQISIDYKSNGALLPISSEVGLRLFGAGGESDPCFFSAVRTEESAATAAALWDPPPWLLPDGLVEVVFDPEDELNAEFKAAKASLLCLGPPWPDALVLSCNSNMFEDWSMQTSSKIVIGQKTKQNCRVDQSWPFKTEKLYMERK